MSLVSLTTCARRGMYLAKVRYATRFLSTVSSGNSETDPERKDQKSVARLNAERIQDYLEKYGFDSHREASIVPQVQLSYQVSDDDKLLGRVQKRIPPVSGKIPTIETIAQFLEDSHGAFDVDILDVREKAPFADWLVVCSGRTERHVRVIADGIKDDMRQCGILVDGDVVGIVGSASSDWKAVDVGSVVIHVMTEDARELYDLEGLWKPDRIEVDTQTGDGVN